MQSIFTVANFDLKARQPNAFKMNYELLAGDELVATLHFRSGFGTFATGESTDGCWTFKRVGFFHTHVTVRACNSETDLAVFHNNTWSNGGSLVMPDGRKFPASTNFWATQYDFRTEAGIPLIHYKFEGILNITTKISILPEARQLAELPWMVMLGWYLLVMLQMDAAAGAAAAAAAA